MTDHYREDREALIEKATDALADDAWVGHSDELTRDDLTMMVQRVWIVFEQAHTPTSDEPAEPEQTEFYEVMGGQGLMRIAKNLTREEAEEVREKFDRDCHRYGLMNPPTRINKQHGRY